MEDSPSREQVHRILDEPSGASSGKRDIDSPVGVDFFECLCHVNEVGCSWSGVVEVLLDGENSFLRLAEVVEH